MTRRHATEADRRSAQEHHDQVHSAGEEVWSDNTAGLRAGATAFLVKTEEGHRVRRSPAGKFRDEGYLYGWLGRPGNSTDLRACGIAKAVKVSADGSRVLMHRLVGDDMESTLEEMGYPDIPAIPFADSTA